MSWLDAIGDAVNSATEFVAPVLTKIPLVGDAVRAVGHVAGGNYRAAAGSAVQGALGAASVATGGLAGGVIGVARSAADKVLPSARPAKQAGSAREGAGVAPYSGPTSTGTPQGSSSAVAIMAMAKAGASIKKAPAAPKNGTVFTAPPPSVAVALNANPVLGGASVSVSAPGPTAPISTAPASRRRAYTPQEWRQHATAPNTVGGTQPFY